MWCIITNITSVAAAGTTFFLHLTYRNMQIERTFRHDQIPLRLAMLLEFF